MEVVHQLIESAYRGESSRRGWTTEADLVDGSRTSAAEVASLVEDPDAVLLVAEREGAVVGCCVVRRQPDHRAHVGMLAVRPELQGGGVGRALLGWAEDAAAGWGARQVVMHVIRQRRELIAWYARLGYRATGATAPFPYDAPDTYPRRPDLEFSVLAKDLPATAADDARGSRGRPA